MPQCEMVKVELSVTQKNLLRHLRDISRLFGKYYRQLREQGMSRIKSARGAVILSGVTIEVVR